MATQAQKQAVAKKKAEAAAAANADLVLLVALQPIRHDGVDIGEGSEFVADADAAAALLDAGAAEVATPDASA